MDIPYGRSNFEEIRRRGYFYVDKTPFLPTLERGSMGYPLLLRPRRFGKSTFLSLLETYYDLGKKDQFDELFRGLWIAEHPTPERNSYLILTLDFSNVSADGGRDELRRSFFESVRSSVQAFLLGYRERVPALGEVQDRLDKYQDPEALLGAVLAVFSEDAKERVFNSDMVLYLWGALVERGRYPASMLDRNVRTEVRHLQRIGTLTGTLAAERRELLENILSEGRIRTELIEQFGVKSLASRAPYLSLLYHLGMLTLTGAPRGAEGYELEVPNRVIRELHWEHLAHLLQEQSHLAIDTDDLQAALAAMALRGDIAPFLELFHAQVLGRLGIKDTRGLDERTLKLLFMMYVSLGRAFHPLSEKEFAQGYCDLFLGAARNVADARYSWLIEFKHLPTNAKPAQIEAAFAEARAQVERYASDADLLPLLLGHRELKAGMLVFFGAKRILFRPWPAAAGGELSAGARAKAPATAKRTRAVRAKTKSPVKAARRGRNRPANRR